mmetsp:Transcript_21080/g.68302  ORF Transcript_21080/g.68302 Transcript_21080/m.68302 type:complete len:204 (+) Transcript_21080:325-936(+)
MRARASAAWVLCPALSAGLTGPGSGLPCRRSGGTASSRGRPRRCSTPYRRAMRFTLCTRSARRSARRRQSGCCARPSTGSGLSPAFSAAKWRQCSSTRRNRARWAWRYWAASSPPRSPCRRPRPSPPQLTSLAGRGCRSAAPQADCASASWLAWMCAQTTRATSWSPRATSTTCGTRRTEATYATWASLSHWPGGITTRVRTR